MEANEVKQFLLHLAECASKITLPGFRTSIKVTDKSLDSFFDPVTDIDLRTEKAITNEIKIRFPEHGISGEEYGSVGFPRTLVLDNRSDRWNPFIYIWHANMGNLNWFVI